VRKELTTYYAKNLTMAIVFKVLESYARNLAIITAFRKIGIRNVLKGIILIFTTLFSERCS